MSRRLNRLLKNSDLPVLCRRLKPTQIVSKELIGTTESRALTQTA